MLFSFAYLAFVFAAQLSRSPDLLATTSRRRRWRASKSDSFERCGEAREALREAVLAGDLGAALAQRCLLGAELVAAGSELLAAPGERIAAYLRKRPRSSAGP